VETAEHIGLMLWETGFARPEGQTQKGPFQIRTGQGVLSSKTEVVLKFNWCEEAALYTTRGDGIEQKSAL